MALYTALTDDELSTVCRRLGLGALASATGIPQGSINTNYRLETATGRYFLRHTTVRSEADLGFEAALLRLLQESHFPAPTLHPSPSGEWFLPLRGGFVSVFGYLAGEELTRERLTAVHAERLGAELGKLHRVAQPLQADRPNPYGRELVEVWLEELVGHADPQLRDVASFARTALQRVSGAAGLVPRGVIHADLFMDNVKWLDDRVSALFDFEMACKDELVLDLAITLNAWCFDGQYRPELCQAMVRGYCSQRPMQPAERARLYEQTVFGAARYTASRIRDFHLSPLGPDRLFKKDYRTYAARLQALVAMGASGFEALTTTRG